MKRFVFKSAKWKRSRPMSHIGLAAAIVPILLCGSLAYWEPFGARALRDIVFDLYQRWSPRPYDPDAPVRVVAIDDESLARVGQWPWPRAKLAELVERLTKAGAAVVALDGLFSEPERRQGEDASGSGDQRLANAIGSANLVLGITLAEQGAAPPAKAGFSRAGADPRPFLPRFNGALLPVEPLREPAAARGHELRARPGPRRPGAADAVQRRRRIRTDARHGGAPPRAGSFVLCHALGRRERGQRLRRGARHDGGPRRQRRNADRPQRHHPHPLRGHAGRAPRAGLADLRG